MMIPTVLFRSPACLPSVIICTFRLCRATSEEGKGRRLLFEAVELEEKGVAAGWAGSASKDAVANIYAEAAEVLLFGSL